MIRFWTSVALALVMTTAVFPGGQPETASLVGIVTYKGNDPVGFLALTDANGQDWKLTGPQAVELGRKHQNQRVKVYVSSVPPVLNRLVPPELKVIKFEVLP